MKTWQKFALVGLAVAAVLAAGGVAAFVLLKKKVLRWKALSLLANGTKVAAVDALMPTSTQLVLSVVPNTFTLQQEASALISEDLPILWSDGLGSGANQQAPIKVQAGAQLMQVLPTLTPSGKYCQLVLKATDGTAFPAGEFSIPAANIWIGTVGSENVKEIFY